MTGSTLQRNQRPNQQPNQRHLIGQQRRRPQLLQQAGTGVQLIPLPDHGRSLLLQQGHDPVHQRQLLLLSLGFGQRSQGGLTQLPQVARAALGGFCGVEGLEVVQGVRLSRQDLVV